MRKPKKLKKQVETENKPIDVSVLKNILPLEHHMFNAFASYDYDTYTDHGTGDYDSYTHITNLRITSIDFKNFTTLREFEQLSELDEYCVDRVVRHYASDSMVWYLDAKGGYYGDDADVSLKFETFDNINKALKEIGDMSNDADKIKKLLEIEYGYVLESLKPTTIAIIATCSRAFIKTLNDSYYMKLSGDNMKLYAEYDLPRAIVRVDGDGRYLIVDGYHRLCAAPNDKPVKVIILR